MCWLLIYAFNFLFMRDSRKEHPPQSNYLFMCLENTKENKAN